MHNGLSSLPEIARTQELNEVICGLKRGAWYVVYAPPRSGKTVFLSQLIKALGTSMRGRYVNLRSCSHSSLAKAYNYLADSITPGSRAENLLELRQILLAVEGRMLLVVDDVGSASPKVVQALLNAFSALHAESRINAQLGKISIVLAAGRDLQELGQAPLSCLNTFQEIFLRDFSLAELTENLGECGSQVWQWTEGHPGLSDFLARNSLSPGEGFPKLTDLETFPLLSQLQGYLPEYLTGYEDGVWQNPTSARALRITGLAKLSGGRLVVRNPLVRGLIEQHLSNSSIVLENLAGKTDANLLLLNRESKEVYLAGSPVATTPVEFRILTCLLANSPRVISKDMLSEAAFPFDPNPCVDVESHIKNLRRKLQDEAKNPRFIRCRRGFGYQAVGGSFKLK
ncbi:MAG TPA: winged helix-turn-helix domain-containing protein [Candidatus Deferrimicrobium sp.]|nr:winged helix-turn-helix domain-containing protein [Candidatus Deferrimicrobium sp.]